MKQKLISDFDGIWTNQNIEAEYVWDYILNSLSQLSESDKNKMQLFLENCKAEMNKQAHDYGWYNDNYVAAYFNEDPFGDNNAIFDYINKTAGKESGNDHSDLLIKVKESVLKKHKTLADFSQECFMNSTKTFKEDGKLIPVDSTKEIVEKLKSLDVQIVVASNSKTEKIKYLFSKAGIDVSDEDSPERNEVHALGDARKFVIDNTYTDLPEFLVINEKFKVPLRRKSYHKILSDERPDYVIGDVFSLDIALPLYLRTKVPGYENLKVVQRVQPYTPDWVKEFLSKEEYKEIAFMVDSVIELPDVISANLNHCHKIV